MNAHARNPILAAMSPSLTLFLALAVASCGGDDPLAPGPDGDQLAVLMIGNSLTYENELPDLLFYLLDDLQDEEVYIESVAFPNFGLPDHWQQGAALDRIERGGWDIVILQQGPSATEGRPYLLEYAEIFAEEIHAVGADPGLFMVWPAKSRFFDFDGVLDSYATAAELVDGYMFPAGEGWRAGWSRDPELPFYDLDGFHPSILGSYMAALVMAQQITGGDLTTLDPVIKSPVGTLQLGQELADLLHASAHEANALFGRRPTS
jgi:hypothetical protein